MYTGKLLYVQEPRRGIQMRKSLTRFKKTALGINERGDDRRKIFRCRGERGREGNDAISGTPRIGTQLFYVYVRKYIIIAPCTYICV